jgi:hypothetical protein
MRTMSLALAALVVSGSIAAAQTPTAPRIDGEGINIDAAPPPGPEPSHPAERKAGARPLSLHRRGRGGADRRYDRRLVQLARSRRLQRHAADPARAPQFLRGRGRPYPAEARPIQKRTMRGARFGITRG